MRWRGDDRVSPCTRLAALSFVIAIGQAAHQSAVVTVALQQTRAHPSYPPCVSIGADGRFLAFVSAARLVPGDTNDRDDIYVLDRESGDVTLETADVTLVTVQQPVLSGNGRILVYETSTQGLAVRDRESGAVRLLQRGEPPNGHSRAASISADGRYIAFASSATNLVDDPDPNGVADDVYVADTTSMTFRRLAAGNVESDRASATSFAPAISEDGRFVAFSSTALVRPGATARVINTYLHDARTGATATVSVGASGDAADGSSYSPAISGDGRFVAFVSLATNLLRRGDRNRMADVYVRDTVARTTELISRTPSGQAGNGASRHPALSGDGRFVVFQSEASDLTCGRCPSADRDINLVTDIFRHDRRTGKTELISRGRTPWMEPSIGPAVDRTGGIVAFASRHPRDGTDDRHDYDLFVWTRASRP